MKKLIIFGILAVMFLRLVASYAYYPPEVCDDGPNNGQPGYCDAVCGYICEYEGDSAFCSRLGKECGSVTGDDNCLEERTVDCGPVSQSCPVDFGECSVIGTQTCINGEYGECTTTAQDPRIANCLNKECGDDLCGGTCPPGCLGDEPVCNPSGICVPDKGVYWSDSPTGGKITTLSVNVGKTKAYLILRNSGLAAGTKVNFEIEEWNVVGADKIRVGDNALEGTTDENGDAVVEWTITKDDLSKTENDYDKFYFMVKKEDGTQIGSNSGDLSLTIAVCTGKGFCMDYKTEGECDDDVCNIAGKNPPGSVDCADPLIKCGCLWNEALGCGFRWWVVDVGTCIYTDSTTDDCTDGWLTYTWTTRWEWDPENEEHNDPDGRQAECVALGAEGAIGETAQCPAQVKLPFFGFYQLIGACLAIAGIYFFMAFRKKR